MFSVTKKKEGRMTQWTPLTINYHMRKSWKLKQRKSSMHCLGVTFHGFQNGRK